MNSDILSDLIVKGVTSVHTVFSAKGASRIRKNRPCFAIVFKFEGETEYVSGGKSYISNKDRITLLPKGSSYTWTCKNAGHCAMIEFESDFNTNEILQFKNFDYDKVFKIFKELEYKTTIKEKYYRLECLKGIYDILLLLSRSTQKSYVPTSRMEKIQAAIDYIGKNYSQNITNDFLASLTPYSTVYFRKLFTEVTGKSPIAYIHSLRTEKAKAILKSDHSDITDIALSLGYSSIYEFSKTFKKHTGISPTKYIKQTTVFTLT